MDVGEGLFLRYQGIFQAHIHTLLLLYKYKWQIRTSLTGKGVMLATLALFKWLEPCSVLGEKKSFFFPVLGKKNLFFSVLGKKNQSHTSVVTV